MAGSPLASEGESRVKRLLLALGRWYVRHIPAHRGRSRLLRVCFQLFPGERFTCRLKAGFLMSLPVVDPVVYRAPAGINRIAP